MKKLIITIDLAYALDVLRKKLISNINMQEHIFILLKEGKINEIKTLLLPKTIHDESIRRVQKWQRENPRPS